MNHSHTPAPSKQTEQEVYDKYYAQAEREAAIKHAKAQIELAVNQIAVSKALLRLEDNEDFKLVIEKGYVEGVRNSTTRALGRSLKPEARLDFQSIIAGVGNFQSYLEGVMQLAHKAELSLPQLRDELAAISSEPQDSPDGDDDL
jgi:hypothetical protein